MRFKSTVNWVRDHRFEVLFVGYLVGAIVTFVVSYVDPTYEIGDRVLMAVFTPLLAYFPLKLFYSLFIYPVVGGIALGKSAFNQASAESPKARSHMAFRWFWRTLLACLVSSLIAGIPYYLYFGARTAAYANSEGIKAGQIASDPIMRQTLVFVLALSGVAFLILGLLPFTIGVWLARSPSRLATHPPDEQADLLM